MNMGNKISLAFLFIFAWICAYVTFEAWYHGAKRGAVIDSLIDLGFRQIKVHSIAAGNCFNYNARLYTPHAQRIKHGTVCVRGKYDYANRRIQWETDAPKSSSEEFTPSRERWASSRQEEGLQSEEKT